MDNSIKITIGVIIILVLVVIKVVYDEKKYMEKLTSRLKRTWGQPTRKEYSEVIWKNIKYYHEIRQERMILMILHGMTSNLTEFTKR